MHIDDSRLIVRFQSLITETEKRLGQRRPELTDELHQTWREVEQRGLSETPEYRDLLLRADRQTSDDLHRRPRIEKAAVASVLHRSHVLAAKIADELRNKTPEHFFDELWLADIYYSLEHVADVLNTVNGSQTQHPQRQK